MKYEKPGLNSLTCPPGACTSGSSAGSGVGCVSGGHAGGDACRTGASADKLCYAGSVAGESCATGAQGKR